MDSSRALPTGVVTFLLTDIEGSTRLWEAEPEAMRHALEHHDSLVNVCVRRLNGHVVKSKGEGDSVFAVFQHARDAVTAALVVQCALAGERWHTSRPIRVRMAIHTGQVELRQGDYYGPTVNRCARLRALARGGQVLISGVTARLTAGQLPSGASLNDLGSHELKDLSTPERVWELAHPRLATSTHPSAAPAKPAPTSKPMLDRGRAYVLTDHLNRDADGHEWGERVTYDVPAVPLEGFPSTIRCYATPTLALLMNSVEEGFRIPRVWEATADPEPREGVGLLACEKVTTLRQATAPNLTGLNYARFAVLCARDAYAGGRYEDEFKDWAAGWLGGDDSSGTDARELAERLERDARPDDPVMTRPHLMMLANAARAAAHASKLSWLAGRARDEENSKAITCATEAVHTALRMAQLDLLTLSEQAMPSRAASPVGALRPKLGAAPDRILRALPT